MAAPFFVDPQPSVLLKIGTKILLDNPAALPHNWLMLTTHTKKAGHGWKGVVKRDGKVIWECCHTHRNRDMDSWEYVVRRYLVGQSATTCALKAAKEITQEA